MAESGAGRLVLASASPYRRRMLEAAGLSFQVVAAEIDETALKRRLMAATAKPGPDAIAESLAQAKAEAVSRIDPGALVIGADQVLALGDELFDKPGDLAAARAQLKRLRGKTHHLHTAAAVALGGKIVWSRVEDATLTMRCFSLEFLDRYLAQSGHRPMPDRRRLRDRRRRHPAVRARRGRSFHHHRPAADIAPGRVEGPRSHCSMSVRKEVQSSDGRRGILQQAARAPLPITPEACLRHDAGRGWGWGYPAGTTASKMHSLRATVSLSTGTPEASPHPYPLPVIMPKACLRLDGRGSVCSAVGEPTDPDRARPER